MDLGQFLKFVLNLNDGLFDYEASKTEMQEARKQVHVAYTVPAET